MSFVTAKRDIILESAPPLLVPGKSRQRPMTSGQATGRLGMQERARVLNKSDKKRLEHWGKEGFFFTEVGKVFALLTPLVCSEYRHISLA